MTTCWLKRPADVGQIGFSRVVIADAPPPDLDLDLGWMEDMFHYLSLDPIRRKHAHGVLTWRWRVNGTHLVLPVLAPPQVLLGRFPGDPWQQFATLRLLYAHLYSLPGDKVIALSPGALYPRLTLLLGELNRLERELPELRDGGFRWIEVDDAERSVIAYQRGDRVVCAMNFTPVVRHNYRVGVPRAGRWTEVLNTDAVELGGSGQGNLGAVDATPARAHGRELSLVLTLPPLAAVWLRS